MKLYFLFTVTPRKRGRPQKKFKDSSDRSKRRKIADKKKTLGLTTPEVVGLAKSCLVEEGKNAAADMLSQLTEHSESRPIRIRKAFKRSLDKSNVSIQYQKCVYTTVT